MGAWGPGSFENDYAMDWAGKLCAYTGFEDVHNAIDDVYRTDPDDEVEAPESACAIAAAEVVASALSVPSKSLPADLASWLEDHRLKVSKQLYGYTLSALRRIKAKSELKELWDESPSARKWYAAIANLETRLAKGESNVGGAVKPVKKKASTGAAKSAKMKRGARARIGDVIEVHSRSGFHYAIYTHDNKRMGCLIQFFDRKFDSALIDVSVLRDLPVRFSTFTHIPALLKCEGVRNAGSLRVPEHLQPFPLFRCSARNIATGKVVIRGLWDGEKEWKVGERTPDQRKLSIRSIPSFDLLIERLDTGWRPEDDDE